MTAPTHRDLVPLASSPRSRWPAAAPAPRSAAARRRPHRRVPGRRPAARLGVRPAGRHVFVINIENKGYDETWGDGVGGAVPREDPALAGRAAQLLLRHRPQLAAQLRRPDLRSGAQPEMQGDCQVYSQIWTTSPYWSRCAPASVTTSRSTGFACTICRIRLLQSQHPRGQGRRLRNVPRPRRSHAAHDPEIIAADGVVPRLSPRSVSLHTPGRSDHDDGISARQGTIGARPRLVREYKIADIEHITNCSVCHR